MGKSNNTVIRRFSLAPALLLCASAALLLGCAVIKDMDDPCALANRDVTFSVLVENSMVNSYNACLADRREDIIELWGQE